tara:strand:- start:419 stop:583 length:165 start_codon:yes stop_codon:yes gene_type:complete
MSNKTIEDVYKKILKDKLKYISDNKTEMVFRKSPTPEELEGLLLWLNKEKLANA